MRASFWVPTQSGQPETGEPEGARTTSGLWRAGNTTSARASPDAAHRRSCSTWVDARSSVRAPPSRMRSPRTKPSLTAWCARRPTRRAHPKIFGARPCPGHVPLFLRSREGRGASPPRGAGIPARALALPAPRRPGRASRFSSIAPRLLLRLVRPRPHPPNRRQPRLKLRVAFSRCPLVLRPRRAAELQADPTRNSSPLVARVVPSVSGTRSTRVRGVSARARAR